MTSELRIPLDEETNKKEWTRATLQYEAGT